LLAFSLKSGDRLIVAYPYYPSNFVRPYPREKVWSNCVADLGAKALAGYQFESEASLFHNSEARGNAGKPVG
jgi:hypothetical protein